MRTRTPHILILAAATACQHVEPQIDTAPAPTAEAAPLAESPTDSVWTYLSTKYDADQDGTVTADEYKREGGNFGRLDSDQDGVLTAADFGETNGRAAHTN